MRAMNHPDYKYQAWPVERRQRASRAAKKRIREKQLAEMTASERHKDRLLFARIVGYCIHPTITLDELDRFRSKFGDGKLVSDMTIEQKELVAEAMFWRIWAKNPCLRLPEANQRGTD